MNLRFHLSMPPIKVKGNLSIFIVHVFWQAIDEDMDSHGSDDSETFTTPPASIIAGNDTESLNVELPEGEEAMEEEQADQEWKSIMPEVVVLKAILSLLDSLHVRASLTQISVC